MVHPKRRQRQQQIGGDCALAGITGSCTVMAALLVLAGITYIVVRQR